MITVHHLNNSRSQRVLWMLEELGLPYEVIGHRRDAATGLAPADARAVHPLGKFPVIVDGDLVLAESGAILEYLVERHGGGRLAPAVGTAERVRFLYWMHYAEGSAMPLLTNKLLFDHIEHADVPFFVRPVTRGLARKVKSGLIEPQIAVHLDWLEAELGESAYFVGEDFTAADIQMSFPLQAAAVHAGLDGRWPRLVAWIARIEARPAWIRSVERGGAYAL